MQRSLADALALDRYGGTRLQTGFVVGAALGGALGVAAIIAAQDADGGTKVGLAYAAVSVTLLAAVGALIGLTIPVWHPVSPGAT